ncbi:hypothetical protein [Pseudoteredinibacter isoporae]|uniref:Uncharacterized protein n=2 Tax=Pseudoteredinibacter isoporae TaxID=570281 RepID=A0A7X0JWC8_9GAMM|nr:hypothetical protein [Pseudoteredinibacter isoporae]MBB6523034.1 hypothetical protein [Pseudoteredinibacter isoporae]
MNRLQKLCCLILIFPAWTMAQSFLESPGKGSIESGVGLVRGWSCEDAQSAQLIIDGEHVIELVPGGERADTANVCQNDGNNGFGSVVFWGTYGLGEHEAELIVDGKSIENRKFTIAGASKSFVKGLKKTFYLDDFPRSSKKAYIEWSEANQNFVIKNIIDKNQYVVDSKLATRKGYARIIELGLNSQSPNGKIHVESLFGETLKVTICSRSPSIIGLCEKDSFHYVGSGRGDSIDLNASWTGSGKAYVWVQMLNKRGQVITPDKPYEFQIIFTPDTEAI